MDPLRFADNPDSLFPVEDIEGLEDVSITDTPLERTLIGRRTIDDSAFDRYGRWKPVHHAWLTYAVRDMTTRNVVLERSFHKPLPPPWKPRCDDNEQPGIRLVRRESDGIHVFGAYDYELYHQLLDETGEHRELKTRLRPTHRWHISDYLRYEKKQGTEVAIANKELPYEAIFSFHDEIRYYFEREELRKKTLQDMIMCPVTIYQQVSDIPDVRDRATLLMTGHNDRNYLVARDEASLKLMTYWLGGNAVLNVETTYKQNWCGRREPTSVRGTPVFLQPR